MRKKDEEGAFLLVAPVPAYRHTYCNGNGNGNDILRLQRRLRLYILPKQRPTNNISQNLQDCDTIDLHDTLALGSTLFIYGVVLNVMITVVVHSVCWPCHTRSVTFNSGHTPPRLYCLDS
jgi:hypothetical protein